MHSVLRLLNLQNQIGILQRQLVDPSPLPPAQVNGVFAKIDFTISDCFDTCNNTAACLYCDAMPWLASVLRNNLKLRNIELQGSIEDLKARSPTSAQNRKFQWPHADPWQDSM